MDVEAALAELDPDQRAAVLSDGAPLCVVAPAGSGKTRVLTWRVARRILDGSAAASHVLVLTFTRRAAGELGRRLRATIPRETVTAGTFHGIAHRLLRQRADDVGRPPPALLTNRERLVEEVLADLRGGHGNHPLRTVAREIAAEIDWARARMVEPGTYVAAARAAERRPAAPLAQVADLYARYEAAKQRRRVLDFDDLLVVARREIERDPGYAAAIRWRFRHLFVDEFQDVNPLQHALLEAWRGGRDDLCVVGDPNQAIYGWTGADGGWLDDFTRHYPRATLVHLGHSHRSSPQIVAFGHAVLSGTVDGAPSATRPDGSTPRVHHFADARAEATGVVRLVREARRPGGHWSSIAVLARTHAQLLPIADAMAMAGVPHRSRGAGLDGYADPASRAALAELRTVTGRGSLRAWLDDAAAEAPDQEDDGPDAPPMQLCRAVEELLEQDPTVDGPAFVTWLATGGRGDRLGGDEDAVGLLTFHAAKGLEWPIVLVVGAVPGLVPHASARRPEARAEERRLFHVAVTRAEHELHVTWYGTEPSPLLPSPEQVDEPVVPPPADLSIPTARSNDAEPVLQALRAWRRDVARAARIEECTVVDDRTLGAIAAARPTSIDALATVVGVGPVTARRHGPRLLAAIEPALARSSPD